MEDIKEKFKQARNSRNQTQVEASIDLGCSLSTISKLESTDHIPSSKAVMRNIEEYIRNSLG